MEKRLNDPPTVVVSPESISRTRALITGFAPLVALYLVYTVVRWWLVEQGALAANDHADEVIAAETLLRLNVEPGFQALVLQSEVATRAANYYYVFGFFPVLIISALVALQRVPEDFVSLRRVFSVSLILAIFSFALFPLTPPRLLPASYGYIDTLMLHGPHYYGNESGGSLFNAWGSLPSMVNVHAAMPSMHVGWSVVAGLLLIAAFRGNRFVLTVAIVHPVLMALAVLATANHYVLDIIAGLLVLGVAFGLTRWLEQICSAAMRYRVPA